MKAFTCLCLSTIWWCIPVSAHAQSVNWPPLQNFDIGITIHSGFHPALSDDFVEQIYSRTQQILEIILGENARIVRESYPNLDAWLETHELKELAPTQCSQFGVGGHQKNIIINLHYEQGEYRVAVTQYDKYLDALRHPLYGHSLQRVMVKDIVASLARQSWSPVGVVTGKRGDRYVVEFEGVNLHSANADWNVLKAGSILQLYSEVWSKSQIKQGRGHSAQFLLVTEVEEGRVIAKLAVPEPATGGWFENLGRSQARYLTRVVAPNPAGLNVRVRLEDTGLPREGCAVFLSKEYPESFEAGELVGLTTAAGRLPEDLALDELLYLTVGYEDRQQTSVIVPGITPSPLEFSFQYRGDQSRSQLILFGLENQLSVASIRIQQRIQQLERARKLRDVDTAEKTATEIGELLTQVDSIRDRAQTLERSPEFSKEPFKSRVQQLISEFNKIQTDIATVSKSVTATRMDKLEIEFEDQWNAGEWRLSHESLKVYLKYAQEIGQSYPDLEQKQRLLQRYLNTNDPKLIQDRDSVTESIGVNRIEEYQKRWPELKESLDRLVANKDYFTLVDVYDEFQVWYKLINEESQRLTAVLNSQTLELEEVEQVRDDLKELANQKQELDRVSSGAVRVIQTVQAQWRSR